MQKMIFDADLTMGVPDCDIDDGLCLLYALGYEIEYPQSIEILGLCTSYGNSTLEIVHENAQRLFADLALDIPLLRGASHKDEPLSEAAHFLVEQANRFPGDISLSVTGSLTNLKGALTLDKDVLKKFKQVVLMGGITQTLVFNGVIMDELNFSCDSEASFAVLQAATEGASIVVMTANNCLPAHFMPAEFEQNFSLNRKDGGYFYRTCKGWFDTMKRWYDLEGFCCWDVLTSAYILEPELFLDAAYAVSLNPALLKAGYLEPAFPGMPGATINAPTIADPPAFCQRAYQLWRNAVVTYAS